jgi:hypothetical protein
VPRGRHKHAKAPPRGRGVVRVAVPVALIAAAPVGAVVTDDAANTATTLTADPSMVDGINRAASPSRSLQRQSPAPVPAGTPTVEITSGETADPEPAEEPTSEPTAEPSPEPEPTVDGYMFATAGLNVRESASVDSDVVTVVASATELAVTGVTDGAWVQVLIDGTAAWVHGDYLSEEEPAPDNGVSYEPCPHGSDIEASLTQDAIRVYRAVCARFPSITSYGGYRSGGGAHGEGRAVDVMISDSAMGDQVAAWVRENYKVLGVSEVIWSQQIWTVERSSDGWRWMEDRGSATANHYDHVHITVYGNSGG